MWTNLFTNERRYRVVGQLWERWAVQEVASAESRQAAENGFPGAYQTYVAALTLRAMAILGYTPHSVAAPAPNPGVTVPLVGPEGELVWSFDREEITVAAGGTVVARVVAIEDDLAAPMPPPLRQSRLDQLDERFSSAIVVYPGLRAARAALPEVVRRRLHPAGLGSGPWYVPATPLEIEGEERVARALRWTMQGRRFADTYPPEAAVPAGTVGETGDWLRFTTPRRVRVTRRPSAEERAEFERSLLDRGAVVARRLPRGQSTQDVHTVLAAVDAAVDSLGFFDACPVDHHHTPTRLRARDRDTFRAACDECHAAWGTRVCGGCAGRYPILWPHHAVVDPADGDRLDHTAGADRVSLICCTGFHIDAARDLAVGQHVERAESVRDGGGDHVLQFGDGGASGVQLDHRPAPSGVRWIKGGRGKVGGFGMHHEPSR